MNPIFKRIKNIQTEGCVTIVVSTHRSHPENEGDALRLKNLVKNAEERLYDSFEKRFVWPIMEHLEALVEKIDHRKNLESLLIFANKDMAEYTRLAINVTDRVIIDDTFATRDLVRAEHEQEAYYTLVLSKNEARLIEAMNDNAIAEVKGNFPYENQTLYNTDKLQRTLAGSDENLIKEFFNRIDKEVQTVLKAHSLPVIIIADERNLTHFMEIADRKEFYLGGITKLRGVEGAKIHHIIDQAWPEVHKLNRERNAKRMEELGKAVGSGKFLSDLNEIWNAILQGKAQTLFIKKGYFQPGIIEGNKVVPVETLEKEQPNACDDIIDEMIEQNLAFGGDTVFIEGNALEKFQNIALITRY
ncbi:AOC03_06830 family ribosome hibernation factor [Paucihalobacter sp.]|uniref:AOC03_06830 family ribosome hibernation factor n=1 Tax=Paucihalobacter sp. TaxID=2850405 RepID=UPI002FE22303